eukprot:gene23002-9374_t
MDECKESVEKLIATVASLQQSTQVHGGEKCKGKGKIDLNANGLAFLDEPPVYRVPPLVRMRMRDVVRHTCFTIAIRTFSAG